MVFMTDSADHISGKAGLTLTITASKNGAAFASISPTVTERGNGWYLLDLTTAHTDTIGDLAIRATATGADPTDLVAQVRAAEAIIATNLDATVSSRSTFAGGAVASVTGNVGGNVAGSVGSVAAPVTLASSQPDYAPAKAGDAMTLTAAYDAAKTAAPTAAANASAVRTELATELARVDASISSRLSSGDYTAPDNTSIGQINARLPSDPADQSLIIAATDQIRADIASIPAAPTAQQIAVEILDNQTA